MIRLRGKTEAQDPLNKIYFEPRPGFTRGVGVAPSLEFPLVYGHRCPFCTNVIQALFKAPKMFNLWPYEETTLLSQGEKNSGEIRKVFPDDKTRFGKSCYRVDFSPADGGSVKITLKNHILRHQAIKDRQFNGDGLWEPGEKACMKAGVFSLREDLLVKDFLLFSQIQDAEIQQFNIPPVKDLIPDSDPHFKLVPAVGVAPPVILVERQSLVYGFHYQTRPRMQSYKKSSK